MKCLVTGGAGFIGSNLVDELIIQGDKVTVVDDLSTGKKENLNDSAKFYKIKIENPKLYDIFKSVAPDIVFHLAAQSSVVCSTNNPEKDVQTNILGTINLLKCCVKYKVKKLIFSSTGGALYGNTHKPATEDNFPSPASPYGISKFSGEQYIKFYSDEFKLNYCILRYANVYGPRQDPHGEAGVVAIFSQNMIKNVPCTLYGLGTLKRDYVYVKDIINANILAVNSEPNQTFNIGTGVSTAVKGLFEIMGKLSDYSISPILKPKRGGELEISCLDYSKATRLLHWRPQTKLNSGLEQTIKWFSENSKTNKSNVKRRSNV